MLKLFPLLITLVIAVAAVIPARAENDNNNKLVVLWTSGDRDVALKVCFMYTQAAKKNGWFDEVRLVVWGPSAKLLSEDKELQQKIADMQKAGVEVMACVVCANMYGVADDLKAMGIEVKGMGAPLTEMLKSGWNQLTF